VLFVSPIHSSPFAAWHAGRFWLAVVIASVAISLSIPSVTAEGEVEEVVNSLQKKSEAAQTELSKLRETIQAEKIPLSEELNRLEDELIEVRKEYDRVLRIRDGRSLDVSNLKAQIKSREDQNKYLANLLDEYGRNLETRLHIAESQRYGDRFTQGKNGALNSNLSLSENFQSRLDLVDLSVERIEEGLGGAVFPGSAADSSGVLHEGKFLMLGPIGYFSTEDGSVQGLADAQLNSNEPVVTSIPEETKSEISQVIYEGKGILPVDPTLGNAIKVSETRGTLTEEWAKGGAVMYPLLGLAAFSLLIGMFKWFRLSAVKLIPERRFREIMTYLEEGRPGEAIRLAEKTRGPEGEMLAAGIRHSKAPRSMVEELLFEHILEAKTKLNSMLPFISITAASAPLLGLLGTVTGMINTFKLITIFGTGDAQTFSSGISEALITTKWGLIVAIPSLLLYGFLSRKAKTLVNHMEQMSINFLNNLPGGGQRGGGSPQKSSSPPDSAGSERPGQGTSSSGGTARGDDPGLPPLPPEGTPA